MSDPQNYANHGRLVPAYHGAAALFITAYLGWAIWHAVKQPGVGSVLQVLFVAGVVLIHWYARVFALTVQDRVIRLEERLRLARLLSPELQPRIADFTPGQLVGLRFASDEELPDLAREVLDKNIRDRRAIKQMIRNWRPDQLRA